MNAPGAMVDVVRAAREVRDAHRDLGEQMLNGSLHDIAAAKERRYAALVRLDEAFGEDP